MGSLSENISIFRKEKGFTQEELGRLVGVSTQAVSKWENGGMPDTPLLPVIADSLEVSIDALFGRTSKLDNIENLIINYLHSFTKEEVVFKAYELCWAIELGMSYFENIIEGDKLSRILSNENETYSQVAYDNGFSIMKISSEIQYFFIMPKTSHGYKINLCNKDEHIKLFKLLSQKDVYDILILIYSREYNNPFTIKFIEKNLNIPSDYANEILKELTDYKLVIEQTLELDDETITVYNPYANPAFLPFLASANEIINRPSYFKCKSYNLKEPYFKEINNEDKKSTKGI